MSVKKPYHRNYRAMKDGPNSGFSQWGCIIDSEYAQSPEHHVRAFKIIQADLEKLFEYVEPSDASNATYSYRIHELLMRACIEVESNFKAILKENKYSGQFDKLNIDVYKKIDKTHHLSSYDVSLPIWDGGPRICSPFDKFAQGGSPDWWKAYNASKHDRSMEFKRADFHQLIDATSALVALLSSQFRTEDFSPASRSLAVSGYDYYQDQREPAIGGLFRVGFPNDWTESEKYEFDWSDLRHSADRFERIDYDIL